MILGIKRKLLPSSSEEFRKLQNGIENSLTKEIIYTPPIASAIPELVNNWEKYVNDRTSDVDPLIRTAIAHYQFEAIHPFSDGNGRTGRILMVLQLIENGLLQLPVLYVSSYINKHKVEYYQLLKGVTENNDWNSYIRFMLEAFASQAKQTKEMLFQIRKLYHGDKRAIKKNHRGIYSADLVENLFCYPIITPVKLATELGIHYTTASKYLAELAAGGILTDVGKSGKYHLFVHERLIKVIRK